MKKLGIVILFFIVLFICFGFYNGLEITGYTYSDNELPKEFDGYRIAFISDLHCKILGKNQNKLIQAIKSCEPDIVVFTGDMIDGHHNDISPVKDLLDGLAGRYPIYTVSGNHEDDNTQNYKELLRYYEIYKVKDLDNSSITIFKNGAHIGLYGKAYQGGNFIGKYTKQPDKDINEFNILLYHDATAFTQIYKLGYNLVLSGHTHGGIIRLPLLGGMVDNNGALFSEYDNGMYHKNSSTLISNRGLGDIYFPRFYNRPELVCCTLRVKE